MPFKSMKQMKYLYATHPGMAKRWSMEMKKKGQKFPTKGGKRGSKRANRKK